MTEDKKDKPIRIRDLYPHMSDEELAEAEANLKAYVAVIVRIDDRIKAAGKSWPHRKRLRRAGIEKHLAG